jgi:type I restriction enzyme S subunit
MSEWKEYRLGDIVTILGGFAYKGEHIGHGEGLLLGMGCVSFKEKFLMSGARPYAGDCAERYYANPGDLVLATRQQSDNLPILGMPAIIPQELDGKKLIVGANLYRVSNNSDFSNKYLYWLLKSNAYVNHIASCKTGTTVSMITKSNVEDFVFKAPEKQERARIVSVLSSLDDKIDLLNRENATLEALAETLFRHYFIETPNPAWKEGKLGDYVIETIGGEWGTEVPEGESNMPVRCLRGADVADLNDGIATRTPLRYIKPSKFEKIKPNNGDIILEISGGTDTCSTGRVAYINDSVKHLFDYPIVFSNFCRLLRVKEEYMYFIYCYFRYLHKQGEFFNLENGSSGIHNLNYKAALYDDLGWPVPTDRKWVIEFGEKVKPYFDKINTNKKQSLSLSAQRDTLLPRLMSGEVKVTEL